MPRIDLQMEEARATLHRLQVLTDRAARGGEVIVPATTTTNDTAAVWQGAHWCALARWRETHIRLTRAGAQARSCGAAVS